ncbi:ComEC/Rec2 family competence protein [Leifsonia sp. AG29]|uniref:ComEC/Rec2 family competence protein n=1 Tax=Leifsonia sp. AG29 TaxID=2598860 RepID=UPI001E607BC9|nr:ComEC/Rec2 family competence protein [Leifsonia sp. AG29]
MPDLRLACAGAALWASCALSIGIPSIGWAPAVALGAAALLLLLGAAVMGRRAHRVRSARARSLLLLAALSIGAAALGSSVVAVEAPGRAGGPLAAAAASGDAAKVVLRIETAARPWAPGFDGTPRWSWRGTVVDGVTAPHVHESAGTPVTVVVSAPRRDIADVVLGATVSAEGRLRANEAGEATSFTLRAATVPAVLEPPPWWLAWAVPVRAAFAEAASRTPGDGGDLLPGLAIGDETAVSRSLDDAMKASSLSHLTAVSGANCALVTGLVFFLAARLGFGRRSRVVLAGVALAGFVVLVGPGASVIRAAAMASVLLLALARGRPADGVPALGLAVIALLVHDPWLSRDYGFALSVFATAGLLLLARPLADALSRWMPRVLGLVIAVPLAAQLACQPILILLTPSLPLYAVPANLLAEPAAPIATVLGCVACAVLPWWPALGDLCVQLAWLPSAWIARVARVTTDLPATALPWPDGLLGVLLCALLLIAVALVSARGRLPRAVVRLTALLLVASAVVYLGVLTGAGIGRSTGYPQDWQIAACDVGQGDALLVRDGDAVMMIDVGRDPELAAACLDRLRIDRVDVLVLTHFDADHVGGLEAVATRADRALVGSPGRAADDRRLSLLATAGVEVETGTAGMRGSLGRISWRLLWPSAPPGAPAASGNDGSLTVETEGLGIRALFLGDLGEEAQDELLATGALRPVDVVKVAHHGSADQSPRLYDSIGARLGLLSVGRRNGYGHPTASALRMLARSGTAVARTDEQGLLLIAPDSGGEPVVWSERSEPTSGSADPASATRAGRAPVVARILGQGSDHGDERGEQWRPEPQPEEARPRAVPPSRSPSWPGTRSARHPSSS